MKNKGKKKQTNMFLINKKKMKGKNLCYFLVGDQSQSADWQTEKISRKYLTLTFPRHCPLTPLVIFEL